MKRLLQTSLLVALLSTSLVLKLQSIAAAETQKGITVAPAVLYFDVSNGRPTQSQKVAITNNQSTSVSLKVLVKNVDESTGILAPTTDLNASQSKAITVDNSLLKLSPGESATVTITVSIDDALKPGGSYFSLVVTQVSDTANAIGVNPSLGTGIFVTNENGAYRHITLTSSSIGRVLFGIPSSVKTSFKNDGNVVVTPRGIIVISSKKGDAYMAKGVINTGSQPLFPGKSVVLESPVIKLVNLWLPARAYSIYQYRFDGTDQITTVSKQVIIIPPLFCIALMIIAIITTLALRYGWRRRTHNKRTPSVAIEEKASKEVHKASRNGKKIDVKDATDGDKITVRTE